MFFRYAQNKKQCQAKKEKNAEFMRMKLLLVYLDSSKTLKFLFFVHTEVTKEPGRCQPGLFAWLIPLSLLSIHDLHVMLAILFARLPVFSRLSQSNLPSYPANPAKLAKPASLQPVLLFPPIPARLCSSLGLALPDKLGRELFGWALLFCQAD